MHTASLTHWGRVTLICVSGLTIPGSDNGLSPGRPQAIIWTMQCWNILYWTLRNKLQGKFNWNSNIFIHENAIESVVCEMAAILSRPQCVNNQRNFRNHVCHCIQYCDCWWRGTVTASADTVMAKFTSRTGSVALEGQMAANLQTTVSKAFSSIKIFKFRKKKG